MAKLSTQTPLENSVGGGNLGLFVQLKQNADGTFATATAADCFADAAATVHILGSQIDSGFNRNDKGQFACPVSVIENDADHLNMLLSAAPYVPTLDNPEDQLEDGTIIGGADGVYGDTTKPFFLFVIFSKPTLAGKQKAFVFIGQFSRAGGHDQKAKQRNKFKFTITSVDGQGYVATTLPTHARTASMTGPTLSGNAAQGQWVTAT